MNDIYCIFSDYNIEKKERERERDKDPSIKASPYHLDAFAMFRSNRISQSSRLVLSFETKSSTYTINNYIIVD